MAKIIGSKFVPKSMQPTYDAIDTLTDTFCAITWTRAIASWRSV
jgi:hypothetical protein